MNIHPLSVVAETAMLGSRVQIGPFCVVESGATLGDGCILESNVVIKSGTTLGANNHIFEGAVLGGYPQHTDMPENPGRLVIGDGNTIRENATIHQAMKSESTTRLGGDNLVMGNVHIAHDCHVGNNTILTNNVMLAGHVVVEDRVYMGGAAGIHQFGRIGTLAMVGGQAHLSKDVPPFVMVDGISNFVVGLNKIGLRRTGFDQQQIRQLKAAYQVVYRSGLRWEETLTRLQSEFFDGPAAKFYEFLSTTTRGITPERRMPPGATIKLRREPDTQAPPRAKAG